MEAVTSLRRRYAVNNDSTLVIKDVNRHDTGKVTCQASNGFGAPVEASAFLAVQCKFE